MTTKLEERMMKNLPVPVDGDVNIGGTNVCLNEILHLGANLKAYLVDLNDIDMAAATDFLARSIRDEVGLRAIIAVLREKTGKFQDRL